jgi:hypothetical protein
VQATRNPKPLVDRCSVLRSSDLVPDLVAPNANRSVVYGPADVASKLVNGVVTNNARPRRRAARPEGASGSPDSELPPNRLIRATVFSEEAGARDKLLVCPVVDIYSSDVAHRRVRVQFDRALSPAQRFNLALAIQKEAGGSVHMAGQDAIVVLPGTVTTTDMRWLRSTEGVYNARSQARPVDPVPQLGEVPTEREIATTAPTPQEVAADEVVAFLVNAAGPDPHPEDWDRFASQVQATRVGQCNFHAAAIRIPRHRLQQLDGTLLRCGTGTSLFSVSARYLSA